MRLSSERTRQAYLVALGVCLLGAILSYLFIPRTNDAVAAAGAANRRRVVSVGNVHGERKAVSAQPLPLDAAGASRGSENSFRDLKSGSLYGARGESLDTYIRGRGPAWSYQNWRGQTGQPAKITLFILVVVGMLAIWRSDYLHRLSQFFIAKPSTATLLSPLIVGSGSSIRGQADQRLEPWKTD